LDRDDHAALYAELKNKMRWALASSLPTRFRIPFPRAMDWAGHYASDAVEQLKIMDEAPGWFPYFSKNGGKPIDKE